MLAKSFPPDVVVLDANSLIHARFERGKKSARVVQAKSYPVATGTFAGGVVTPLLENPSALTVVLRRVKLEQGRLERVSLLLPDSWFRINILELPKLPENAAEASEVVRWSLKRSLPIRPEEFRVAHQVIERGTSGVKVLVVAGFEKSLASIEATFTAEEVDIVLIEPVGLNIWNAVVVQETPTTEDRVFIYLRPRDFTTAVFRGTTPLFVRSRNLSGERTLQQEIKLSASYLRSALQTDRYARCYLAGNDLDQAVTSAIAEEFGAPAHQVSLADHLEYPSAVDTAGIEAELTACTGVFTV